MADILENLGEIQSAIHRGDEKQAIEFLEALGGDLASEAQQQIQLIRSGKLRLVGDWLERTIDLHSDVEIIELDGEISMELGSAVAGFQISESDFVIREPSGLNPTVAVPKVDSKRNKLKAKLAHLKSASEVEAEEKATDQLVSQFIQQPSKSAADPFADLMEMSDTGFKEQFNPNKSKEERGREDTPVASVSVSRGADLAESSTAKYRGEPRLGKEPSSGITANRGFSKEKDNNKTNVNASHLGFTRDDKTGLVDPVPGFSKDNDKTNASSGVSFVAEEPQQQMTNLGAIRLEAKRLFEAGELEAALDITKKILSRNNDDVTSDLRNTILDAIEERDTDLVGDLTRIPKMMINGAALANSSLDHKAGYLVSMIDGMVTFEDLIDLSGMPKDVTLKILATLLRQEIIS